MSDHVSEERRSFIMSRVGSKDTQPEMLVRRALHRMGYRYRLHRRDLPGTPDIVFPSRRAVLFVHGCFWHGHECRWGRPPRSRREYWISKIETNRERDKMNLMLLKEQGWVPLVVWQCELKDFETALSRIAAFLDNRNI